MKTFISELSDGEALFIDGFDNALLNPCHVWHGSSAVTVAAYSHNRLIDILCSRDGMTHDEAEEYISFNILGAYMGAHTPVVLFD